MTLFLVQYLGVSDAPVSTLSPCGLFPPALAGDANRWPPHRSGDIQDGPTETWQFRPVPFGVWGVDVRGMLLLRRAVS